MTLFKQHTGQYAVKILKWNGYKQEHIALIPLRTDKKDIALIHLTEVKKVEIKIDSIKWRKTNE